MRRLLGLLLVVGLLLVLPLSHISAAKPAAKVSVCHVNSANDIVQDPNSDQFAVFGRVISVNANAVAAHVAHGDSTEYVDLDEEFRDLIEEFYEVSLPNANCFFIVDPD